MRAVLALALSLFALSAAAQEVDTSRLRAQLDALLAQRLALDAERDRLGAVLDSLDAIDDELTAEASALERELYAAGVGDVGRFEATAGITLRLLATPELVSVPVATAPAGAPVTIVGRQGDYWLVTYEGSTGYVREALLDGDDDAERFYAGHVSPTVSVKYRPAPAGRELHVGPRGGCYYVADSGSKVYVDRSECTPLARTIPPSPSGRSYTPSSSGRVRVRGYYRSDGTYVRPHTRSRPRRRN